MRGGSLPLLRIDAGVITLYGIITETGSPTLSWRSSPTQENCRELIEYDEVLGPWGFADDER